MGERCKEVQTGRHFYDGPAYEMPNSGVYCIHCGASPKINYLVGDATNPTAPGKKLIAHICNDVGAWGAGFVVPLGQRWPRAKEAYLAWKGSPHFRLGETLVVGVAPELWVANMIAQNGLHRTPGGIPLRYNSLRICLSQVAIAAKDMPASVHMPRIGCGLAGGDWEEVETIIWDELCSEGLDVFVYDLPQQEQRT